ncbi:MAG TPA: hypothetical protein VFJ19_09530 [Nocardioidaceae bacterium]|nr:hypothetical protein [Nocardioidaceae bacterium]
MTAASSTRRRRGADTQRHVAGYLRTHGWRFAEPVGAGSPGADITGVPGLAVEVKARRGLDLPGWLRQAARNAAGRVPLLVVRPDGFGPATVDDWPVTLRLADAVELLHAAGYGDEAVGA